MSYFVGLDVSLDETAISIVDDAGVIFREGKADTEPEAIATWLNVVGVPIERLGLEADPLSPCRGRPPEPPDYAGEQARTDLQRSSIPREGRRLRGSGGRRAEPGRCEDVHRDAAGSNRAGTGKHQ